MATDEKTYFRTGLGLKKEVLPTLEREYHSRIVELLREGDFRLTVGDVTVRLAEQFGYCYGVDRAVQYAYETTHKFPDRRLFLVGEIIHNPHVNRKMREMGIEFVMPGPDGKFDFSGITPDDVVIIPAFGVTIHDFQTLRELGCILIDTTCGSVLNVWKRVEGYAKDGYTAIIHGKHYHEETKATASQVDQYEGGKYLIVRNLEQAREVCDYIVRGEDPDDFLARFGHSCSEGFDPDRDLARIGVANQTTMLASETAEIAEEFRRAMIERYGEDSLDAHFRRYDTLCSATQDRQDAVKKMMEMPPDVMVVIGGYNSSNTNHLAMMCAEHTRTYHIEDSTCIDPEARTIRHKAIGGDETFAEPDWLPEGPVEVGVTAGASTPNNKIGDTVDRILRTRGLGPGEDGKFEVRSSK